MTDSSGSEVLLYEFIELFLLMRIQRIHLCEFFLKVIF